MSQRHVGRGRDAEGQVLDVDRRETGMIEPERGCTLQVTAAQGDLGCFTRAHSGS